MPRGRRLGKYRLPWWECNAGSQVDQPRASALLLRGQTLEKVGLFDEQFPIIFNDVDLCYRLKRAGWAIWFTPAAEMIHECGSSLKQVERKMIMEGLRSFLRFYRKHYRGKIHPVWYGLAVVVLSVGYRVKYVVQIVREALQRFLMKDNLSVIVSGL